MEIGRACYDYSDAEGALYCKDLEGTGSPCYLSALTVFLDCVEENVICDDPESLQADTDICLDLYWDTVADCIEN